LRADAGRRIGLFLIVSMGLMLAAWPAGARAEEASVVSIEPEELQEFELLGPRLSELVKYALSLTERELVYRFGSNQPAAGGMDCSGTVQRTLHAAEFDDAPRTSYGIYRWAEAAGTLVPTPGVTSIADPVFDDLRPGDLLFWQGTYETAKRNPPISHVMIYLGTLESDGQGVVFGASEGRRFRGKRINGVSVFDWKVPSASSRSSFVGYARIPGLDEEESADSAESDGEGVKVETGGPKAAPRPLKSALEKLFGRRESGSP